MKKTALVLQDLTDWQEDRAQKQMVIQCEKWSKCWENQQDVVVLP